MNPSLATFVVNLLATLTLVGQILILIIAFYLANNFLTKKKNKMPKIISKNALSFAFLVSVIATTGSLFFSEIANFVPCKLCWFQRIFMYPQVIILGIATFYDDFGIKKYIITLSAIGLAISIYHYLLQFYPTILKCTDEIASCSAKQFAGFGYITIPMMAATAFLLIILLLILAPKKV